MQISGFEMIEKLGRGGMATVYKARQVSLDRTVAIKILSSRLATDPADVQMFQREAQSAAKLKHPGIVQVYDANVEKGFYYFVMEYVAGYTVGDWLRRSGVLPEKDALLAAECVADALDHAWEKARIIHCDIKPDNIMVDSDGTVKVADLGLARTLNAMTMGDEHAPKEVMGTPAYMSPEQGRGDADLDCRADIYSLGAMLYHLVTGKMLFEGTPDDQIIDLQITETVSDPLELNPRLSKPLCYLIEKMLAKDREHRQKDWAAVKADISRVKRKLMPQDILQKDGLSTVRRSKRRASIKAEAGRASEESRAPGSPLAIKLVIVGSVLGVVALVVFLLSRRAEPQRMPPPVVGLPPAIPERKADEMSPEAQQARVVFEFAKKWAQDNPEKYDEAIEQFNRIIGQTRNTPYAAKAEAEIKGLGEAREVKVREILEKLKSETSELVQAREYAKAADLFENYKGPLAAESKARRMSVVKQLREGQGKLAETKEKEKQTVEQKVEKILDEAVTQLVKTGIPAAQDVLTKAMADDELAEQKAKFQAAQKVLREGVAATGRISEYFNGQRGKEVTVQLKNNKVTCLLTSVEGNRVQGKQRLSGGTATVPVSFDLADLAPREKLLRLGADEEPGVALMKGLIALESRAYPYAKKYFGMVDPVLSERLIAYAGREETDSTTVEAEQALAQIMQSFGLPGGRFDAAAWLEAIRGKTLSAEECNRLRDAVLKYRASYGGTEFAKKAEDILVALDKLSQTGKKGDNRPPTRYRSMYESEHLQAILVPDGKNAGVIQKFMSRNLRMAKEDIHLFADAQGNVSRVEIASAAIEDLSPVADMKDVKELYCSVFPFLQRYRGEAIADLSNLTPLKGTQLEVLSLCLTSVKDLSPLKGLPLKELYLRNTPVMDILPLKGLPLQILDLHNTKVKDLSPLREMKLWDLNLSNCKIHDFKPLAGMTIQNLDLSHTQIKDSAALKGLSVRSLNLCNTRLFDFGFLGGLPLENLDVSQTQIKDVSMLAGKDLVSLNLAGTAVVSIDALKGMPIKSLILEKTLVKDFAPLKDLPLASLVLGETRIQELSALEGLPLRHLDVSRTSVSDLSPLRGMKLNSLNVSQSEVRDLGPLRGMPLNYLSCRLTKVKDLGPLAGMPLRSIDVDLPDGAAGVLKILPAIEVVNGQRMRK